ncbi:Thrombospondin-4, partial [Stegodyphus mimosarum]
MLCLDINECDDGRNGGCVENSQCLNTMGSFTCGECIEGFVGNQTFGCHPHPGMCPDGTVCDGNADCELRRGLSQYQCRSVTVGEKPLSVATAFQ